MRHHLSPDQVEDEMIARTDCPVCDWPIGDEPSIVDSSLGRVHERHLDEESRWHDVTVDDAVDRHVDARADAMDRCM